MVNLERGVSISELGKLAKTERHSRRQFRMKHQNPRCAGCGIGSNFCMGALGRMPGPRGAGILPAACNGQVSRVRKKLMVVDY